MSLEEINNLHLAGVGSDLDILHAASTCVNLVWNESRSQLTSSGKTPPMIRTIVGEGEEL